MWNVYKIVNGVKSLFAQTWSESLAWTICKENTSLAKVARGIRFDYERASI